MNALNYSTVRENFGTIMDQVCRDHEPVVITREGRSAVVMVSLADFESLEKAASSRNSRRISGGVKNSKNPRQVKSVEEHPFFGMLRDTHETPEEIVNRLRENRNSRRKVR